MNKEKSNFKQIPPFLCVGFFCHDVHESGYILGGRSLTGVVIAGSMLLTNISTEHLIGMNGSSYRNGAFILAWEVTSSLALILTALYFAPRYLKMGLTTIPEFLERRFDGLTSTCLLYTSPSPRDKRQSRMPSSA